jgi:hypothetical protein
MGLRVAAIARGADKKELALKLGAHIYIDSVAQNPAQELQKLGGARAILATASNAESMGPSSPVSPPADVSSSPARTARTSASTPWTCSSAAASSRAHSPELPWMRRTR